MGGVTAFPLTLPNHFKIRNRYKPSRRGYQRIARLIPFCVILPAQDMEKVPFMKSQLLPILICRLVVVERFNNLFRWNDRYCRFGGNRYMLRTVTLPILITLQGPPDGLKAEC